MEEENASVPLKPTVANSAPVNGFAGFTGINSASQCGVCLGVLLFLEIRLSFHACQSFGEVAGGASLGTPDGRSSR